MPVIGLSCTERLLNTTLAQGERHHLLSSTYTAAIVAEGATPVLLPSTEPQFAEAVIARIDGLVITGGGDIDPSRYEAENSDSTDIDLVRDAWELALLAAARRRGVPTLGICRGCQVMNVGMGGTLIQHVWDSPEHTHLWNEDRTHLTTGHHAVMLTGVLRDLYGTEDRRVNSLHHQAVDRLPDGLEVVATAPDGRVEAVAATGSWPAIGVQWHPERLDPDSERPLFAWLVAAACDRGAQPRGSEKASWPDSTETSIVSPST